MIIKENPEDFIVTEKINIHIEQTPQKYTVFELKKIRTNTIAAIDILTKKLGLKQRDIGFAGIKDKQAITTQYISIPNIPKASVHEVLKAQSEWIKLTFLGYCKRAIATDMLEGNTFTLKVKQTKLNPNVKNLEMINYFGEQRFSIDNAQIGKALIKKDYKRACELLKGDEHTYNQKLVSEHLKSHPQDYIGAMRLLPRQTINLLIHSYQSLLWNKTIATLLNKETESESDNYIAIVSQKELERVPEKVPLVGFFYEPQDWSEDLQKIIELILAEEKITPRDFINKQFPESTEMGAVRYTKVRIENLQIIPHSPHELNTQNYDLSFYLQKGSYATIALKFIAFESQN
jgi:tRNA pseudouridine13 synthase